MSTEDPRADREEPTLELAEPIVVRNGDAPGVQPGPQGPKRRLTRTTIALIAALAIVLVAIPSLLFFSQGESRQGFVGEWSANIQSIEILENGEARGTDGCNGQSSSWSYSASEIRFDGFTGTMMACLEPDGRMLNGWLGRSASAAFDSSNPDHLVFYDSEGERLGVLVRVD